MYVLLHCDYQYISACSVVYSKDQDSRDSKIKLLKKYFNKKGHFFDRIERFFVYHRKRG